MKKKMVRIALAAVVLLFLTSFMGAAASAETGEGGYWAEQVDEDGNVVRVFTYTEPVVVTQIEGPPMESTDEQGADALEETLEAPVHMANAAPAAAPEQTAGLAAGVIVLGVLTLAGLAFVLYKAV